MMFREAPQLDRTRTTWHITFGTYGSRLHGDSRGRPTVDPQHNQFAAPFLPRDAQRMTAAQQRMTRPAVKLTRGQCLFIQEVMPDICQRGGWGLRLCAAADNHVHVLIDIDPATHGEMARRLIKRWLTQKLNERWESGLGRPGSLPDDKARWWAEQGSNKAVRDADYLRNVYRYIERQRMR